MKRLLVISFFLSIFYIATAENITSAENSRVNIRKKVSTTTITGSITNGTGYSVLLVSSDGASRSANVGGSGTFSFKKISTKSLKNSTLHLVNAGRYAGPVVLKKTGNNGFLAFSGKLPTGKNSIKLGKISLKNGAGVVVKAPPAATLSKTKTALSSDGVPLGAGKLGLVEASAQSVKRVHARDEDTSSTGADPDGDGIISAFDADDDGDLVLDALDSDSASGSASENPFTTLFLSFGQTLNVNISGVTQDSIDAVISGDGLFSLIYYFSLAPDDTSTSGGHVICPSSLEYCRRTADGGGTALYSGVSESDQSLTGQLWSNYNADGSGYPNLEPINSNGNHALVAGIQPRVGTSSFQPGDVYTVDFVNSTGTVLSTKSLSLAPYFVTVPAMKSYNAGSGEVTVDYSNTSAPGSNSSNPIVLSSPGTLTVNLWRPQRAAVAGAESGSYVDIGHLHYGVIIGGLSSEFTCGGFFTSLSSTLSEDSGFLGEGDSPNASAGANLWPLTDSADDATPDAANTLSFTVDLTSCLSRAGFSGGAYQVTLVAAGEQLSGGANRAAQLFNVTVP